jgi:hypothetical protein
MHDTPTLPRAVGRQVPTARWVDEGARVAELIRLRCCEIRRGERGRPQIPNPKNPTPHNTHTASDPPSHTQNAHADRSVPSWACLLLCALLERFYRRCACFFQVWVEDGQQGWV